MEKSKQRITILKAMIENKNKAKWYASDFQSGEYFVGYEASPRMSEISTRYKNIINSGRDKRFRYISLDLTKEKEIKELEEMLECELC